MNKIENCVKHDQNFKMDILEARILKLERNPTNAIHALENRTQVLEDNIQGLEYDEYQLKMLQEDYEKLATPSFARTKTIRNHAERLQKDVDEFLNKLRNRY